MKPLLFIFCCILSMTADSQVVYLADTAIITDIGYGGAPSSCMANGPIYNSWGMNRAHSTWLADQFTIPSDSTWVFDTVILYGYQFGSTLLSPFTSCNLEIYSGTPGSGAPVIWGDTVTNVLASTYFTGIYRVDTYSANGGLLTDKRPLMYLKLYLSPAPVLHGGTYWLAWSATAGPSTNGPACPPKVLPGRINPAGETGRVGQGNTWTYANDNGYNEGFNMIIKARAGLASVPSVKNAAQPLLSQNTPNPFGTTTTVSYYLPANCQVGLRVYNLLGQLVATLVDGAMTAGAHHVTFEAGDLPTGTYYCKLATDTDTEWIRMTIAR